MLARRHYFAAEWLFWLAITSSAAATIVVSLDLSRWLAAGIAALPALFTGANRNGYYRNRSDWHYRYLTELRAIHRTVEHSETLEGIRRARSRISAVESSFENGFPTDLAADARPSHDTADKSAADEDR